MKKKTLSILAFSTIYTVSASAGWLNVEDVGFKAPAVNGKSNFIYAEHGAIILDTSDGKFYGNTSTTPSSPAWAP